LRSKHNRGDVEHDLEHAFNIAKAKRVYAALGSIFRIVLGENELERPTRCPDVVLFDAASTAFLWSQRDGQISTAPRPVQEGHSALDVHT
jgi:hypothetical protein